MDNLGPIPRKRDGYGGRRSQKGNSIIKPPCNEMKYNTNTNSAVPGKQYRDRGKSHNSTNDCINEMNNPGEFSSDTSTSHFSQGEQQRERQRQQRNKDRKEKQRRDNVKQKLAQSQQGWNKKRVSLEGAYNATKSFDGVRTDRPQNETAAMIVDKVQKLYQDESQSSRTKSRRGRNHSPSALEGSGSKTGRRERNHPHSSRLATMSDDPLDVAMTNQGMVKQPKSSRELSRQVNITKKMVSNMDDILSTDSTKFGEGTTTTHRQRKKRKSKDREEVIDVDCDETNQGSGKKGKTSPHFSASNHSSDSPTNSFSIQQEDDSFHAEGEWGSSDDKRNDDNDVFATMKEANKSAYDSGGFKDSGSLNLMRDPKKSHTGKRSKQKKLPVKASGRKQRLSLGRRKQQIDEIEDFNDNDSCVGICNDTNRQTSSNSHGWVDTNRSKPQQKTRGKSKKDPDGVTRRKLKASGMRENKNSSDEDYRDDEWYKAKKASSLASPGANRRTRSKSKARKAQKKDEVIEILSSSSEEESSEEEEFSLEESQTVDAESSPKRNPIIGELLAIDATRIAVGKKVFKSKCELKFQFGTKFPYMMFSFNTGEGKKRTHKVSLKGDEELRGLSYYTPIESDNNDGITIDGVDDSMAIIAFRIAPTESNQFTLYSKSYKYDDDDSYITVEVRDNDDFMAMLDQIKENQALEEWLQTRPVIEFYELKKYTSALIKDTEKEKSNRRRSARLKRAKTDSNVLEKPIVVFPFEAVEEEFTTAVSELSELKLARELPAAGEEASNEPQDSNPDDPEAKIENVKGSSRTHYITIRESDMERLEPGEFLNDVLVDFWMRWMSGAPNNPDPDVHVFTSHFMTTLWKEGPKAVSSWTAKKNIDIFEKKLIFIPVNRDLHWSLCVVVNPGFIGNNYDIDKWTLRSEEGSFILFLDSLSMHQKKSIARNIRKWLNFEWKRLTKKVEGIPKLPFTEDYMPLLTPDTPRQDNGCDCGVFVCRYAYSLFQMRQHQCFSQFDLSDKCIGLFEYKNLFVFDMADIARIRVEMTALIRNLSKVYLRLKKEEKVKKKSKSTATKDENAVSAVVSAEETKDGNNKSECVDKSLVSSGDNADLDSEDQIMNQTSNEESVLVSKEKENVENSSDSSKKGEEVKRSAEGSESVGSGSETDRSQDLLLDGNESESC